MSRPATSLEDALAACLDDLDRGVSPAECLARFPEHAAELAPLLQVAVRTRAKPLPALSLGGRVCGRERMHAALAQRRAGYGRLRAWVGGLAGLVVCLVLAAGVWFSSPGRDSRLGGEPTAQPAAPSTGANATPSVAPTLEAQISQTPSPSPTSTNESASVTATAAPTPSPTASATPTPSPTASATPTLRAIPTDMRPVTKTAPAASSTAQPVATSTESPGETPQMPEATEPAETHAPARTVVTPQPTPTRSKPPSATPTPLTAAPTPRSTERPKTTPRPGQGPPATPTLDDDHEAPEPTELPKD